METTGDTAYQAGQIFGLLIFFIGGGLLLFYGIQARRSPTPPAWGQPQPPGQQPGAAEVWASPYAEPEQPPRQRGIKRIVFGSILLGFGVVAAAGTLLPDDPARDVTVDLPTTLLGERRNDDRDLAEQLATLRRALPSSADQSEVGLYGTPPKSFFVIAASGRFSSSEREIESFKRGAESSTGSRLGPGKEADAGDLGGAGRCWSGTSPATVYICFFTTRRSLLVTFDGVATDLDDAAGRALRVREAVVKPV